MNISNQDHQQDLQHIKQMMERSSRFISLSGLSGIAAGACALVGAYFARNVIVISGGRELVNLDTNLYNSTRTGNISIAEFMGNKLLHIAIITFVAAFIFSFFFTYLRSKKTNTPLWGSTSKRLAINVLIPMVAGGIYLLKLIQNEAYGLIAPGCLIFYGLALVNASKFTLGEVRYLGYLQLLLGLINLWFIGYGLYFWAIGFGILHIIYGVFMWNKYERN
ncbi:MAG: hypothetical protein ACOVO1_13850 [Chitinophagaceae bacterium]